LISIKNEYLYLFLLTTDLHQHKCLAHEDNLNNSTKNSHERDASASEEQSPVEESKKLYEHMIQTEKYKVELLINLILSPTKKVF
jgi:hypothetical protein